MSVPDLSAPRPKRRTAVVIAAMAAVLVVIAIIVIALTSGSAKTNGQGALPATTSASTGPQVTASSPASSAAAATPQASSVPLPPAQAKAVEAHVNEFLAVGAKSLVVPPATPVASDFTALATGSALDSMVANAQDFVNNGWHQEGVPVVASVKVSNYLPSAKPPQVTLLVCVDSSKVNVLTADGTVVRKGSAADRSLNILTLVSTGGNWLVSKESFPEDPHC